MALDRNIIKDKDEIIIISTAKGWGGAEEYLENLRAQLHKRGIGHRIFVREGGEYSKRVSDEDHIIQIPHGIIGFVKFIKNDFKPEGTKFIHVNRYYDIFRGWYLKRMIPNALLILYQHCFLNHPHRIPLMLPDGIICISEYVKTSITRKFPVFADKIRVINTGIDLNLFNQKKKDYRINGTIKIGMVGRFDKNQEDLIEIGYELKKTGLPINIHFAGTGKPEEEKRLNGLIQRLGLSENVVFRGHIPHKTISHFYLDMDIMVSTMKTEGLSLVALEAMACGVPFVAYNAPGFNEIIDHQENGLLITGGPKEFAFSLEFFIKSMETRKRIGENAAKKASLYFGIERNVKQYLNFIESLLVQK